MANQTRTDCQAALWVLDRNYPAVDLQSIGIVNLLDLGKLLLEVLCIRSTSL